ncbi:PREDICTED: uncharacterized protein LOC104599018 [Nelumbo nucifera]|uniref:Uncharacterized protein LOC104599018 n=2 Tax=Nelumbo nucifera TaxID=4432 RepID=A0A1U8AC22_NELNU|nr:PREDICTED: uncharacterized protein LOC104599018 [Nelumbo nucifera]DAD38011.1 TPA_asm: hypothetical protein HUJ06_008652 [Nelumbo nucifera]
MASSMCLCISAPLRASQTINQETCSKKSVLVSLSNHTTTRAGIKLLVPGCLRISSITVDCGHCGLLVASSRHILGSISSHSNVDYSTYTVMYGYWVGPDVEDGWGYVEAFVDQII